MNTEVQLATDAMTRGDAAAAVTHLRKVLEQFPTSPDVHAMYAVALGTLGRGREALAAARTAVSFDPDSAVASYSLAIAQLTLGHLAEADAAAARTLERKPDFLQASILRCRVAVLRNDTRALALHLDHLTAIAPDASVTHAYWAGLHMRRKDPRAAEQSALEALRLEPESWFAHLALGEARIRLQNATGALEAAEAALRLNPGHRGAEALRLRAQRSARSLRQLDWLADRLCRWGVFPPIALIALLFGAVRCVALLVAPYWSDSLVELVWLSGMAICAVLAVAVEHHFNRTPGDADQVFLDPDY